MAVDVNVLLKDLDATRERSLRLMLRAHRASEVSNRLVAESRRRVTRLQSEAEALRRENAQLHRALTGRPVVDQARGILMAVGAHGPQGAWKVLVDTSQRTNTKLRLVAEMVVAGTTDKPVPPRIAAQLRQSLNQYTAERSPRSACG
ncbi:ANTAR domain-containing protein [Streptomyces venezuelae]|uniref:ANTAR domain-containing protein n=1 Tax=Streptomyces venezuelae TaxID=54571 RepID=A0A5P2CHZ2_STRVZ|nr:ANTAR domain-containing protein [Streptomyces venezuelae]